MIREKAILNNSEFIDLPLVKMTNGITIRLFDPYDMTNARKVICQLIPDIQNYKSNGFKTIIVPATKPIPIAWHLCNVFGLNLVVLKKEIKPYYTPYKSFIAKSITSDNINKFYITEEDYNNINNKKVIFFDDVLSTGATFDAASEFIVNECNCSEFKAIFVLKEGDSYTPKSDNIKWLGRIPI